MKIEIWRERLEHFHNGKLSAFATAGTILTEVRHPALLEKPGDFRAADYDMRMTFLRVGLITQRGLLKCVDIARERTVNDWKLIRNHPKLYDQEARLYGLTCPRDTSPAKAAESGRRDALVDIMDEIDDMEEELVSISDDELCDADDFLSKQLLNVDEGLGQIVNAREQSIETVCRHAIRLLHAHHHYPDINEVKAGHAKWVKTRAVKGFFPES